MPELPEVETMRRGVAPAAGRTISRVEFVRTQARPIDVTPSREGFRRRVAGRRIEQVDRIGKRVALVLDNAHTVVFEPRMTGLVLLADPPTQEHLRLVLTLAGSRSPRRLLFWDRRGLGCVHVYSPEELRRLTEEKLGPDALAVDAAALRLRLEKSRRAIKTALLDQAAVAGIGNLYASEILHLARIHPERPCCDLTGPHWRRLHTALRHVLTEAIRYEGSTLSDGTYRNALNKAGGYQNEHRVYDKAGGDCPTCGRAKIVRIVQAQRSTFFCPRCQARR
ncbi:MAG: bifunctional DNA-formamidopyrimidine glycosylase/DNA-(apurinic or apyrimidinic site) lyase [Planctomycetales bacterium]|nr:bifunctional DNA-formamidopyrimidine glycosylase/DNA-(apurinic or apyrimidinic site) lyase [Planctomycetales bacterium]